MTEAELELENSPNIRAYRSFTHALLDCLILHHGADSSDEEALLDQSDRIWYAMSFEETEHIRKHHGKYHLDIVRWRIYDENMNPRPQVGRQGQLLVATDITQAWIDPVQNPDGDS